MIDVKELIRDGHDTTPVTPRKHKDGDDSYGSGSLGVGKAWDEVDSVAVLNGLSGIAREYDEAVAAKAKAYADGEYRFEGESDDDLYQRAKQLTDEIYAGKAESIASDRDAKYHEANAQKEVVGEDRAAALKALAKSQLRAEDRLKEDLSRRGMTRSSVGALSRESLRAEQAEEVARTEASYDRKVAALDRKIEQANASYESALRNYEISYAIRLEDKLARLKKERDSAAKAYEQEHSQEKKRAYNYYLSRIDAENKVYENEHSEYMGEKRTNYRARYDYLADALSSHGKEAVARFLDENADSLKKYLGLYYDRFVREVS